MKKVIILFAFIFIANCIPYIDNLYNSDKVSTFNYICDQLEDHYVYFDYKGLDFENIKTSYLDQINNDMSDEDFFHQLEGLFQELQDGHAHIFAPFTFSNLDEATFTAGHEINYDSEVINDNYLNTHPVYYNSFKHTLIETGGSLYGYIYYSSFSNPITTYEIEYVLNRFRENNVKGIILDIRNNGGGSLANVLTLLSYLGGVEPGTSTQVLKVWRRDGQDSYTELDAIDSGPMMEISFHVTSHDKVFRGPVALLTNRYSYSASSFTSTAFKVYDNVRQIGGITGGGMGMPIGGTLPNGWTYCFSGNIGMDVRATSYTQEEYNYESGVPVDEAVDDNPLTTTVDEIINAAIAWIDGAGGAAFVDTYSP